MKIVREGWPFIIGSILLSDLILIGAVLSHSIVLGFLAGVGALASVFCLYFFRDPARVIPVGDQLILAPADGRILEVAETRDPISTEPVWMIRIFLSVFEPHLQRSPIAGRVGKITYTKGKFLDARDPKAPFENEQNRIEIVPESGAGGIVVTQIAGLIARRIICWVQEGQVLKPGDKIGLIRFGSQVDVVLPKSATVNVKAGDFVTAGDTVLAQR